MHESQRRISTRFTPEKEHIASTTQGSRSRFLAHLKAQSDSLSVFLSSHQRCRWLVFGIGVVIIMVSFVLLLDSGNIFALLGDVMLLLLLDRLLDLSARLSKIPSRHHHAAQ